MKSLFCSLKKLLSHVVHWFLWERLRCNWFGFFSSCLLSDFYLLKSLAQAYSTSDAFHQVIYWSCPTISSNTYEWHLTTRSCERKQCVARRGKIGLEDEIAPHGNSLNIFHNLQLIFLDLGVSSLLYVKRIIKYSENWKAISYKQQFVAWDNTTSISLQEGFLASQRSKE